MTTLRLGTLLVLLALTAGCGSGPEPAPPPTAEPQAEAKPEGPTLSPKEREALEQVQATIRAFWQQMVQDLSPDDFRSEAALSRRLQQRGPVAARVSGFGKLGWRFGSAKVTLDPDSIRITWWTRGGQFVMRYDERIPRPASPLGR